MSEHLDTQAIAAVRTGEVDRFRELVERYERHVYAVAWARLGDASLAEDATQEAFIRAYRLLGWLRNPARFAGWITRITRAVSINLGLRHRRELRRRERWALDPSASDLPLATATAPEAPEAPPVPADTLREALADLPTRHRECLVLFYLEGQPVTAAAQALGVSEGAFKVRLHRARHALRGQLERHLESSLGNLAPRRSLAPGIMSSILLKSAVSDPTGTSAGLLAMLGAGLAKLIPLPLLVFLLPVAALTVGVGASSWALRVERRNYRDAEGFRRRLYDDAQIRNRNFGAALVLVLVVILAAATAFPDWHPLFFGIAALVFVGSLVFACREYRLTRRRAALGRFVVAVPVFAYFFVTPLFATPPWFMLVVFSLQYLGMVFFPQERPLRFDQNLFLRERLRLLPDPPDRLPGTSDSSPSPAALWAFALFGAREGLFTAYRRLSNGVRLRLCPVSKGLRDWLWPFLHRNDSTLTLLADGTVQARLGSQDAAHLDRLGISATLDPETHRQAVEGSVRAAVEAHLAGDAATALRRLGHTANAEIFKVDPSRTGFPRFQRVAGVLGLLLMVVVILPLSLKNASGDPALRAAHLKVVPYSIDDARAIVGSLGNGSVSYSRRRWAPFHAAHYTGYILPPAEWASNEGQAFLRTNFFSFTLADVTQNSERTLAFLGDWREPKALLFGWAPSNTLNEFRAAAPTFRALLAAVPARERQRLLEPEVHPIFNREGSELELDWLRWRIAMLKEFGLLDLFDPERLVSLLRDHQVLPGKPLPAGRKPLRDPHPWMGLFRTRGTDPIAETYHVLAILDQLGATDRIDRTACADGILRLHLGKGLFLTPQGWDRPFTRRPKKGEPRESLYIPGEARSTYEARESLRILGALGRVPDLNDWQYRIHTTGVPPDLANAHRDPGAWSRVEAALLRDAATAR